MKKLLTIIAIFTLQISYSQIPPFSWAKQLECYPTSITTDNLGNVYTTGVFGGTVDFDPWSRNIKSYIDWKLGHVFLQI